MAETADLAGLTTGFSAALKRLEGRRHDPGRTLTQVVLAMAGGATCLTDLAVLRNQPAMFGGVASEATVWRTFDRIGPAEFRGLDVARREARALARAAGDLIIDIDGTMITTKTDKQDAAPNYKRTYGHPLLAMIAETGEMLCGIMRPGNAGTNDAADHIAVLDAAIAQLPDEWAAGHDLGDHLDQVQHRLLIRADAGGANHWLSEEARLRNAEFSIGYSIDQRFRDAIMLCDDDAWTPAVNAGGKPRADSLSVARDFRGWSEGVRHSELSIAATR